MVGAVSGLQLAGNGIGGLVGAALISGFHTWRAIFIFLAIGGGVTFILPFSFSRNITENSGEWVHNAQNVLNKAVLIYLPHFKTR